MHMSCSKVVSTADRSSCALVGIMRGIACHSCCTWSRRSVRFWTRIYSKSHRWIFVQAESSRCDFRGWQDHFPSLSKCGPIIWKEGISLSADSFPRKGGPFFLSGIPRERIWYSFGGDAVAKCQNWVQGFVVVLPSNGHSLDWSSSRVQGPTF